MIKKEHPSLEGKHVAIFGASSGLGAALANNLNNEGAQLYLVSRSMIEQKVLFDARRFDCDITNEQQLVATFFEIDMFTKQLDYVINCVGIPLIKNLQETSSDELEYLFRTNFIGAAVIVRESLKRMYEIHAGHFIQVLSTSGTKKSRVNEPGYAASKAALYMLDQSVADESRSNGVKLTDIITGGMKGSSEENSASKFWDQNPEISTNGFMTTDDVAEVVVEGVMKSPSGVWVREIIIERP